MSSGLVGDDEIVDAYDLPDGVAVVVAWPPYGEANCGQYLIDRHGQLYAMPHETVDTEFCRRYPTRRQRARFAVTERCAASDDGVLVPFRRTALAEQATW